MKTKLIATILLSLCLVGLAGCGNGGGSGCPQGTLNCPCDDGNRCDADLVCTEGYCVPGSCPEGTSGCPCRSDGTCDPGLTCVGGTCDLAGGPGLSVGDPGVRACDVLIETGDSGAASVTFDDSVIGEYVREGSRIAVAFAAQQDAALEGTLALLIDGNGQVVDAGDITLSLAECYNQLGAAVADPDVSFE